MPRKITISLIFLIILSLYKICVDRHILSTDDKKLMKTEIVSFGNNDLKEISFIDITLKKYDDNFRIEKPVSHIANKDNVTKLVSELKKITALDTIRNNSKDLSYYGLKNPKISVILKDNNDKIYNLLIGKSVESSKIGETYAKLDDRDIIYIIKDSIKELLLKPLSYYMDLKPFEFIEDKDCMVTWIKNDKKNIIVRNKEGYKIQNDEGLSWHANNKKSETFFKLISLIDLNNIKYENINDSDSGMDKPYAHMIVQNKEEQKSIILGKLKDKQRFLKVEKNGIAFIVNENVNKIFDFSFKDFVSNNVFEGRITNLQKIIFRFNDEKKEYAFFGDKTDWSMYHDYSWFFHSGKILNYILKFVIKPVKEYQELDLKNPKVSVLFEYQNKDVPKERIDVYKAKDKEKVYIRQNMTNTFALGDIEILENLSIDPFSFISSKPFENILKKSKTFKILINNKEITLIKNEFDNWSYEGSQKYLDMDANSLISRLMELKSHSAMKSKKGVDFGFKDPLITFEFKDDKEKLFFTLKVGSFSNKKEAFILGDDKIFLFIKDFFMIKDIISKENSKEK